MLTYTCDTCNKDYEAKLKPMGISKGLLYPVELDHQILYEVAYDENDPCYYCRPKDEEEETHPIRKGRAKRLQVTR